MVLQNTEGQPDSIVLDIENMVRSYIEKVVTFHAKLAESTKTLTVFHLINRFLNE